MSKHNKKNREVDSIPFYIEKNGLTYYLIKTYPVRNRCIVGCYSSNPEYYIHSGTFEIVKKFHFSDEHARIYNAISDFDFTAWIQK